MTNTTNYGFNLPDGEDFYNIEDFNENMEKIDTLMFESELAISDMSSNITGLIGKTNDSVGTTSSGTVMGKLNKIISNSSSTTSSVIRKITKGVSESETVTVSLTNASKCFVILNCNVGVSGSSQALGDCVHLVSLTSTKMTVSCDHSYGYSYQIIEFY